MASRAVELASPKSERSSRGRGGARLQLWVGGVLVGMLFLTAIFAPLLAPHDPFSFEVSKRLTPPGAEHPLGTDAFGRDILSRVIYGARLSMLLGSAVVLLTGVSGIVLGLAAGYYRPLDALIMRVLDGLMAFPGTLLALAISAALGPSLINLILALSIAYVPRVARLVRSSVLVVRELEHVQAARAIGASDARLLFRHVLPLCWSPIIVQLTLVFALTVLAEASLTFLGVGLSPEIPSWGNILNEGRLYLYEAPWITTAPGLAVMVAVLGLNVVGDALRDLLDPRLRDL